MAQVKNYFTVFLLVSEFCISQTKPLPTLAFGKGVTVIYAGSGAVARHIDWYPFKKETLNYKRSPFVSFGFDHCVFPYASNTYCGLGLYMSSWIANREYIDVSERKKENIWTNTLLAIRASHHSAFFVRKKLDLCSGILVGARMKYYHSKTIDAKDVTAQSDRTSFVPAFGITATARYYFKNNVGVYFEACLGYKTDLAGIGLTYKIH
jgi:hypothetical protein